MKAMDDLEFTEDQGPSGVPLAAIRAQLLPHAGPRNPPWEGVPPNAELACALHDAQEWASHKCRRPISPIRASVSWRAYCDDEGNITLGRGLAGNIIGVETLEYGYRGAALTVIDTPEFRVDNKHIIFPHAASLQFARAHSTRPGDPASALWARVVYTAGWVTTTLTATSHADDQRFFVKDTTGLVPGRRYWLRDDAGTEETVTISLSWTPPPVAQQPLPGIVLLAAPLERPHCEGSTRLTEVPAAVEQAIINYTIALVRSRAAAQALEDDDLHPDTPLNAGTRYVHPHEVAPTLVAEAERLLLPFRE